jgi:chaperone modulatory protein CbpM
LKAELTEAQWLHDQAELSIEQLIELTGLSRDLLRELVDYGALSPINPPGPVHANTPADEGATSIPEAHWTFAADCVVAVRTVRRLRDDFDLDANALSVALMLIERIQKLEAQLRDLQTQFPRLRRKG